MKHILRKTGLTLLAMVPVASVSFAAKAALSVAQQRQPGVTDSQLAKSQSDSHGQ